VGGGGVVRDFRSIWLAEEVKTRDVVYLGRPIAPLVYASPNAGEWGVAGSKPIMSKAVHIT
jgi:hypothetical protein